MTPEMQQMAIGLNDVEWKGGKARFTNQSRYQTHSECEVQAVKKFTLTQVAREVVSFVSPGMKGFFSQSLFIPKKSGTPRWVVDFRRPNALLFAWTSSLAPTLHIVRKIPHSWKYFTVVDLDTGCFNVPLKQDLKPFFCCEVFGWRLVYNRLPQGWASSACLFHDIVRRVISDLTGVFNYMDDIVVGGTTPEEHDQAILALFDRLTTYVIR